MEGRQAPAVHQSLYAPVALREDLSLAELVLNSPGFLAHPDRPILIDHVGRSLTPTGLRENVQAVRFLYMYYYSIVLNKIVFFFFVRK